MEPVLILLGVFCFCLLVFLFADKDGDVFEEKTRKILYYVFAFAFLLEISLGIFCYNLKEVETSQGEFLIISNYTVISESPINLKINASERSPIFIKEIKVKKPFFIKGDIKYEISTFSESQ